MSAAPDSSMRATATAEVRRTWRPGPDDLVDAAVLVVLAGIALVGLTSVYDGPGVVVVGLVGALVGIVAAWVVAVRRFHALAGLGIALAAFVVASGPSLPDASLAGVLPGPGTPAALLDGLVHSWADLVTTAPPVGLGNGMGVVPYVCGFLAGFLGMLVARRTDWALLPAAPGLLALVAGIALGDLEPVSTLVQGGGFALVAVAWGAARGNRDRRSNDGSIYWPRIVSGLAMLAVVLLLGAQFGPSLPGASASERFVARRTAVPPFDPRVDASPLAGYRSYRTKSAKEQVYFSVEGLPKGARVRLATMDTFDGVVWVVSGTATLGSGRFERVGQRILPVPDGETASVEVTVADYDGVWVPSVGTTRSIAFEGDRAEALGEAFRYNRTTGTGASPLLLAEGDRFTLDVRLPEELDLDDLAAAQPDRSVILPNPPDDAAYQDALGTIRDKAYAIVGKGAAPAVQAQKLADYLAEKGTFSDGGPEAKGAAKVASGQSLARIVQLLEEPMVGNAEQYAAAMALMARQLGLPARVVMGFTPKGSGSVDLTGADADAWVEIAFGNGTWVTYDPTPQEDQLPKDEDRPPPVEEELAVQESPPPPYLDPPETVPELAEEKQKKAQPEVEDAAGTELPRWVGVVATYVGLPLGALAAVLVLIVVLKRTRRQRRRTRGSAVDQVSGAWQELLDLLRDLGLRLPPGTTRRELATVVAVDRWPTGAPFAARVDATMFGPDSPDPSAAAAVWDDVERQFQALREPLTRRARLRAAVSLASLRPRRR